MASDGATDEQAQIADGGEDSHRPAAPPARRRSLLTEVVILVVVALAIALTIKTYVIQPFRIPTQSMENTLLPGDKVLVNKLVGHVSQIHRGDIIVFDGNGSWDRPVRTSSDPLVRLYHNFLGLFGNDSGQIDYIKRVIGLPGDRVACCTARGLLTVNGVPLHEGSYLYPGSTPSTIRFTIVVPPGRLWVMGDNREDSSDSRLHRCGIPGAQCSPWDRSGTIPESSVIGRAFMIVWPFSQLKFLRVPATFSQSALAGAGAGLPLSAGLLIAAPLTLLERRLRRRRRGRDSCCASGSDRARGVEGG